MAVAILSTDSWISHLPFVGGQRPSAYGSIDGVWYGVVSGLGDNTGGNLSLNGRLSFDRKEDWVYILGGIDTVINSTAAGGDVFTQVNTGPLIPTDSAVTNPTFNIGGISQAVTGNALSTEKRTDGGADPRAGMPIFGDKRIAGIFLMIAAGWENNVDAATYTLSAWGFLVRYESFFRNRNPARG